MNQTALHVSASVQTDTTSISRQLADRLIRQLEDNGQISQVIQRDLSDNQVELLTAHHVGAYYTQPADRTAEQKQLLTRSDEFLNELKAADVLIISSPMYNFSVPAVLKAWIDLICRVGETFRYTENGPEGLSAIRKAYLVVATGGAPVGSEVDFLVPYLTRIMNFIGIQDVEVVAADRTSADQPAAIAKAHEQIASLSSSAA